MTDLPITSKSRPATAGDYVQLLKPRIMMLVVFTAFVGLVAAESVTGIQMHPVMAAIATLAVALGSGAAGAINMWYDADIDAEMKRTATRPIPSGAVPADEALSMGLILSGVSVLLMWLASNWLAAGLLAFSIVYYGVIYTMWLKRATPQNIVIGGGAGAFPPVIGWAAVTGNVPQDAWILFAIIFMWTPPHFWALSLLAHKEYARVGVPMLPVTHGARHTRRQVLFYTVLLLATSLLPLMTGLGGVIYSVAAILLGLAFLALSIQLLRTRAGEEEAPAAHNKFAAGVFAFSIFYLFALFAALLVEHLFGLSFPVRELL
ncbi:MAG: heme o synthase [Hyphomonadaceae bacterium]|nr:heme o synthase [Hyphomonadaceae bacterium]